MLSIVVGGQFGSEGKGAVAGWLATRQDHLPTFAIRVGGPNAGHSALGYVDGRKWALRAVPTAAVTNPRARLGIAAGSEIDLNVLGDEVDRLDRAGYDVTPRLVIDPQATVLGLGAPLQEVGLVEQIGSTGKGVGAARADRIMRQAVLAGDIISDERWEIGDVDRVAIEYLVGGHVIIEGTQGYGLGLHAGYYPYCTSRDCRAIDFLAEVGVSPWASSFGIDVWICYRPYPIRVAGNSGPLADETSWELLGLETEYTTVTHKPRRVGMWDPKLAREAAIANGAEWRNSGGRTRVYAALTMADQVVPEIAGWNGRKSLSELPEPARQWIDRVQADAHVPVVYIGTSADTRIEVARG